MPSRRDILKILMRLFLWLATGLGLGLAGGRKVLAGVKKRILPKGTDPKALQHENPGSLDTRNLQVMPLEAFETMGDKNIIFSPKTWRLEVTGAVDTPLELTHDDILALPGIEQEVLLVCPGYFSNHGRWQGFSIRELMKKAGCAPHVSKMIIHGRSSVGDRKEYFNIKEAEDDRVFLAHGVNGRTLPQKHGRPLRVVAEGHWGSEWVKYVYKVEFV